MEGWKRAFLGLGLFALIYAGYRVGTTLSSPSAGDASPPAGTEGKGSRSGKPGLPSPLDPVTATALESLGKATTAAAAALPPPAATPDPTASGLFTKGEIPTDPIPADCEAQWKAVTSLDLNRYGKITNDSRVILEDPNAFVAATLRDLETQPCTPGKSRAWMGELQKKLFADCRKAASDDAGVFAIDVCYDRYMQYRHNALRELTRNVRLSDITDAELLGHMFRAESLADINVLGDDTLYAPSRGEPGRADEILRRLLEVDPNNLDANRQALDAARRDYLADFRYSQHDPERIERSRAALEEAMRRVESLQYGDNYAIAARLEVSRAEAREPASLERAAQDAIQREPSSWVPVYYLAWARFDQGDRAGAIAILERVTAELDKAGGGDINTYEPYVALSRLKENKPGEGDVFSSVTPPVHFKLDVPSRFSDLKPLPTLPYVEEAR